MFELAKRSALYPTSLHIPGVIVESEYAVDFGGFGDIWLGKLGGKAIALKVMKTHHRGDTHNVFKVCAFFRVRGIV